MPPPQPAFPNPAAVLPGEADILATVIADLSDDTAKLVYADWLEDRDDPRGPLLRQFVTAFRAETKLPDLSAAPEPWCDLVGVKLCELLADAPALRPGVNRVLALARPAVAYKKVPAEDTRAVGASGIGGCPDLPAATAWPEWEGQPLAFLGQVNFAELALSPVARELPATGLLSLFCLEDGERGLDDFPPGTYRVLYSPDPAALARRDFPGGLWPAARLPEHRLAFAECQTLPDPDGPAARRVVRGKDERSAYENVHFNALGDDHLLGWPHLLRPRVWRTTTRHLITVGDVPGWPADDDVLYFTASAADLAAARFGRVKMTLREF